MSEDWKELAKIPSFTMRNSDNWGYKCQGFGDIVEVTYFEGSETDGNTRDTFSVPTFCAEQLFTELAKLAKEASELDA